jgi:branched-chain amino acid transport system ATP-binding protein
MNALLEAEAVCSGYGPIAVLHEIDLRVDPGTITAVLGANGAGKTTLLKTLSGMIRPSRGSIRVGGRDLAGLSVDELVRHGVAHVPEGRGVIGELTVDENLRLGGLWRHGTERKESPKAISDVYELFEPLARRRTFRGHQLSGGERQMLALGRALVARPRVLLLDEPSLGLAPSVISGIMALLRTLRDTTGLAVLLVEQNVHSALAIADEGVVISLGSVVARGPAAALQADEGLRHAYLGF